MKKYTAELLRHIDRCPIGWSGNKLLKLKKATSDDIISWLRELNRLARDVRDLDFGLINMRSDRAPDWRTRVT